MATCKPADFGNEGTGFGSLTESDVGQVGWQKPIMVARSAHRLFWLRLDGRPTVTAQSSPQNARSLLGSPQLRARATRSKSTEDTAGFTAGVLQHTRRLYCDTFENAIFAHLVLQRVPGHWK